MLKNLKTHIKNNFSTYFSILILIILYLIMLFLLDEKYIIYMETGIDIKF